jgi:hypothetical protein
MLLGNGDEVRRCRDAHTEGQTIEESLRASPYSWRRRFNSNQVPLIPASRRHDYANDLPPPSWLPPFFPSTLSCAQQQQNSTALKAVPPLRCANCRPIYTRSSHFSACFFPPTLYLSFYSCAFPPYTWVEFGYLSHAISVLEARGGTRGFELRNVSGPSRRVPLCWMAAQDSETDSVRSVDVFPSPYSLVTATALATRSKEEERNAEPIRNWLHENARSLTELALKRFHNC